jgi:hypothetical protein
MLLANLPQVRSKRMEASDYTDDYPNMIELAGTSAGGGDHDAVEFD